jgi:hypothetical protein
MPVVAADSAHDTRLAVSAWQQPRSESSSCGGGGRGGGEVSDPRRFHPARITQAHRLLPSMPARECSGGGGAGKNTVLRSTPVPLGVGSSSTPAAALSEIPLPCVVSRPADAVRAPRG